MHFWGGVSFQISAKQKAIYLDSFDIFWGGADTYKITQQQLELPAAAFTDIQTGDYLQIDGLPITKLTQKSDDAVVDNYTYQMQLCGYDKTTGDWKTFVATFSVSAQPISVEVTAEMAGDIKAKGLVIQGYGFTVKRVAYGSTPTYSAGSDIICETACPFALATDWSTVNTITTDLSTFKVGDKITIGFTCGTYTEDWHCQISLADTNDWSILYNANLGGKTSIDFYMTESVIKKIQAGHGLAVKGTNITVNSIKLYSRSSDLSYSFSTALSYILTLDDIPASSDVELTRKFDWYTSICLPFDVDDLSVFGHSAKAYEFTSVTGSTITFTERSKIKAGVPYYMNFDMDGVAEEDKTYTVTFSGVTIDTDFHNPATSGGLTFKGNYTPGFNMENKYGVAVVNHSGSWDWGFYKGGTNTKLNAFSAYIDGTPSASRLSVDLGDGTTSIDVRSKMEDVRSNEWYDLNGRRVLYPTKGLYIVNGKKVIIK